MEVRDIIQGVQVSAPFGNVKYALEVFDAVEGFDRAPDTSSQAHSTKLSA